MSHPLLFAASFHRRMKKKPHHMQEAIQECIRRLAVDPRHPGLHTKRVKGTQRIWEAYIDGANRVTFEWQGDAILLRQNCNHDIVKKSP